MGTVSIHTVSALTLRLKEAIERTFGFVWVRGQVSNLARPGSGHIYFTLKDESACLNVVWFRKDQRRILAGGVDPLTGEVYGGDAVATAGGAQALADGQEVLCGGRLTVYAPRGAYQLIAELVQDVGQGQLHLQFEALKARYAALGYFSPERKRPLPRNPGRVAVITAPTGAAIQDFLRVGSTRGLSCVLRIYPSPVQGAEAPTRLAEALDAVNAQGWAEVVVLIRGGGSIEDLWAFNSEPVAEAIFRSGIPVLSGIGHEVDSTIADMIADVRAATPSHAAQLLWPERSRLAQETDDLELALRKAFSAMALSLETRLRHLEQALVWLSPAQRLERLSERCVHLALRLQRATDRALERRERELERQVRALGRGFGPAVLDERGRVVAESAERLSRAAAGQLAAMTFQLERLSLRLDGSDPQAPLERGYALVSARETGRLIATAADVAPGDALAIRLRQGRLDAVVTGVEGDTAAKGPA